MKSVTVVLLAFVASSVSGCATSGASDKHLDFSTSAKRIYVSEHFSGYEQKYIGAVLRTFEKRGFTATKNRSESDYFLDFVIEGGAIVTVGISLLQDGKEILNVSSTNVGWGTLIARPAAVASRVEAAIDKLNTILADARY